MNHPGRRPRGRSRTWWRDCVSLLDQGGAEGKYGSLLPHETDGWKLIIFNLRLIDNKHEIQIIVPFFSVSSLNWKLWLVLCNDINVPIFKMTIFASPLKLIKNHNRPRHGDLSSPESSSTVVAHPVPGAVGHPLLQVHGQHLAAERQVLGLLNQRWFPWRRDPGGQKAESASQSNMTQQRVLLHNLQSGVTDPSWTILSGHVELQRVPSPTDRRPLLVGTVLALLCRPGTAVLYLMLMDPTESLTGEEAVRSRWNPADRKKSFTRTWKKAADRVGTSRYQSVPAGSNSHQQDQ